MHSRSIDQSSKFNDKYVWPSNYEYLSMCTNEYTVWTCHNV